jgi:hypothetical protein
MRHLHLRETQRPSRRILALMKNWMRRKTEMAKNQAERVEMEESDVDRLGLRGRRVLAERLKVV